MDSNASPNSNSRLKAYDLVGVGSGVGLTVLEEGVKRGPKPAFSRPKTTAEGLKQVERYI